MPDETGIVDRSQAVRIAGDPATGEREIAYETAKSTADGVPVVRTGPTGVDTDEPLVLATVDGQTALFPVPAERTVKRAAVAVSDGDLPTKDAAAVVKHDSGTTTLPVPETGPLATGHREVLGPCGWVNPFATADHDLVSVDGDAGALANTELRGRGRVDAADGDPVADTWATARETDGDPVVVLNANDADERQRADRTLLAGAPIAVLDGMAAVADHVGAEDAIVYLSENETALRRHLEATIDAASDDLPVVPKLATGPDTYRAGAPTAALEALEGNDRIEPRIQPPGPATHGLYGRPTVVHSARTLARVRHAVREGAGDESIGSDTRLFTVTGDVAEPATIELPTDATLDAAREAVEMDGSFKMACVGGVFGGFTESLDVPADRASLSAADLGTNGVVELLNEDRCPVATAGERVAFAEEANSGRCVPGREGTQQLAELLREVYQGTLADDQIRELGRVMHRTSNCRIGAHAPRPVTTAMRTFEPEFEAHTRGRCPSGTCTEQL